jgi:hypothetical protein
VEHFPDTKQQQSGRHLQILPPPAENATAAYFQRRQILANEFIKLFVDETVNFLKRLVIKVPATGERNSESREGYKPWTRCLYSRNKHLVKVLRELFKLFGSNVHGIVAKMPGVNPQERIRVVRIFPCNIHSPEQLLSHTDQHVTTREHIARVEFTYFGHNHGVVQWHGSLRRV